MGYDGILFLVVCDKNIFNFFYGEMEYFCLLVNKGSCFLSFSKKEIRSIELKCL